MEKILVSACLLGQKVKYDGGDNYFAFLEKLQKQYILIPFCPEVEGGLSIPRVPSEIRGASVVSKEGKDVTSYFNRGAERAWNICKFNNIKIAILKDGSPSCGARQIYDGTFQNRKIEGRGITAAYLILKGVKVYSETDALDFLLKEEKTSKEPKGKKHYIALRAEQAQKEGGKRPARKPSERTNKEPNKKFDHAKPQPSKGYSKTRSNDSHSKPKRFGSHSKKSYGRTSFKKGPARKSSRPRKQDYK